MAYQFTRDKTSKFKFRPQRTSDDTITLDGINANETNAQTICNGLNSLMAIGGNDPTYISAVRTSTETVDDED